MNRKTKTSILIVVLSLILSTTYGFIHNYITSSISTEFYTKMMFFNFGILDDYAREFSGAWKFALIWVGFFSTWWYGLLTGLILGIIGLKYNNTRQMINITITSILIIIGIVILFGAIGYGIAEISPSENIVNYNYPFEIENKIDFNKVGTIHDFSYFGGVVGLLIGTLNQIKNWWQYS